MTSKDNFGHKDINQLDLDNYYGRYESPSKIVPLIFAGFGIFIVIAGLIVFFVIIHH